MKIFQSNMILFTIILFSGYLGFVSANECKDNVVFFCLPEDTFPVAFPENEAEINHICPIFIQFTQCILDHIESCDSQESDESNHYKEDFENYYAVLVEICNEDSELHKTISENAMCLKSSLQNHNDSCFHKSEEVLAIYNLYTHPESSDTSKNDSNWEEYYCLFEAYDLACLADDALKKCGVAAKIVILQMIKKLNYLDYSCPETVKEPLMTLIEILNFEKEDVIHLKEIFGIPSDINDK